MAIGAGIGIPFKHGISWNSYWMNMISATVETAAPTNVILTFPSAKNLVASDFTVNGHTIVSASWTGNVLTLVLGEAVIVFEENLIVTCTKKAGLTHAITNNVADDSYTKGWWSAVDLATITKDNSMRVSVVADKTANGYNLLPPAADKEPYSTRTAIVLNNTIVGSPNQCLRAAFIYAQPEFIYMVVRQDKWLSLGTILDGATAYKGTVRQYDITPKLEANAGGSSGYTDKLPLGQWGIIRVYFNGVNSKFIIDGNAPLTGNFGTPAMDGVGLGTAGGASTVRPAKFRFAEIIARTSNANETLIYNYLRAKHADKVGFVPTINYERQGIVMDATEIFENGNVQEPNILYTTTDSIIVGNPCFQMWYSGGTSTNNVGYAESKDGLTWTKYASNPIIAGSSRVSVIKHNGVYYMYGQGGYLWTSTNLTSWTYITNGIFPIPAGYSGPANSCVQIYDGVWYAMYDLAKGGIYYTGLATSVDGLTWTEVAGATNPIIANGVGSTGGPFFIKSSNNRWYLWSHNALQGTLPTDFVKYSSSDLINWVMENDEEFPRMTVDEGLGHNTGQVADCSIVEVAGTTYFFYAGYTDQIGPAGNIKLAKVNKTLDQLAQARIVGQIAEV